MAVFHWVAPWSMLSLTPLADRAPFLAAIQSDLVAGKFSAYQTTILAYADWLEEQGDPECQRLRRLAPAAEWACVRGVMLPDCELVEGVPWAVWRRNGAPTTTVAAPGMLASAGGAEAEPPTLLVGFSHECVRQPCPGEYLGVATMTGRLADSASAEARHIVLGHFLTLRRVKLAPGWRMEAARLTPPRALRGDGVQSLLLSCEGDPPRAVAIRASKAVDSHDLSHFNP
jgi:uncharacterized protein (TIGR02996 family)